MRFFCRRLFAKFFDLRSWLSVSLPLRSVGTPSPPPRESCFFKPRNTLEPCTDSLELCRRVWHRRKSEQRTFGLQSTRPNGTLVLSSSPKYTRGLSHGFYSCSRARVALGRELQLPMSFSWPFFPGLDQDLFPPMVFLVFWDSIPKRCKGVHCVDLGESFPTSIYLQKSASIQPRTSPVKFARSPRTDPPGLFCSTTGQLVCSLRSRYRVSC